MDSYQAIYDSVRSRIGSFDGNALADRIAAKFDFSYYAETIKNEFLNTAFEMQRPSTVHKPKLSIDGDKWCALYGENLQDGVAGFGDSPAQALSDFDKNWHKTL